MAVSWRRFEGSTFEAGHANHSRSRKMLGK